MCILLIFYFKKGSQFSRETADLSILKNLSRIVIRCFRIFYKVKVIGKENTEIVQRSLGKIISLSRF